jgi:hypothetical protein
LKKGSRRPRAALVETDKARSPAAPRFAGFGKLVRELALGELEALSRAGLTGFLSLLLPGVAGEHSAVLEDAAEGLVVGDERSGDSMTKGSGLAGLAAAVDVRGDVDPAGGPGDVKRLDYITAEGFGVEVFRKLLAVDEDLAGAEAEADSGAGALAATCRQISSFLVALID